MIENATRSEAAPLHFARTADDGGHWVQSVAMMKLHDAKSTDPKQDLRWCSNVDNASVRGRATFLNKLENFIARAVPDTAAPLTIISHGSNGLLMEDLAHKALLRRGFSNVRWRCIDPLYDMSIARHKVLFRLMELAATRFAQRKDDVKFFGTESEYLHGSDAPSIAERDRAAGTTVVMTVAPEVDYDPKNREPGKRIFGAIPVDRAEQANAAYLIYDKEHRLTQQDLVAIQEVCRAGYVSWQDVNGFVEATVKPDETLAVDRSLRSFENTIQRGISQILENTITEANAHAAVGGPLPIGTHLQRAIRRAALEVEAMSPPTAAKPASTKVSTMTMMLNHPAVALARLHAFMQRGEQPAFAAELVGDRVAVG